MDMPEPNRMFRCPRCWHTELESRPPRTHCPRCGLAIPRPEPRTLPPRARASIDAPADVAFHRRRGPGVRILRRNVPGPAAPPRRPRERRRTVRGITPALPRPRRTRSRALAVGRSDELDGSMGRPLSPVRGGRLGRAFPGCRRPRLPRPVSRRHRRHDGARAGRGRRSRRRAGAPRNDVHAADRGRRVAGRGARPPFRSPVLAGHAHGDRRESLRHPAGAPPHRAAEDPGLPLVLPRNGGRDVRDTARRRCPRSSRQPRASRRSRGDDARRRVQRRAGPRSRARRQATSRACSPSPS